MIATTVTDGTRTGRVMGQGRNDGTDMNLVRILWDTEDADGIREDVRDIATVTVTTAHRPGGRSVKQAIADGVRTIGEKP